MNGALSQGAVQIARAAVHQEWIAANLANVQTPGYKRRVAAFALPPEGAGAAGRRRVPEDSVIDLRQGELRYTEAPFDVALETAQGARYSRNGALALDAAGVLVDRSARPILGAAGPIRIDPSGGAVTIDETGEVFQDGGSRGRLRLVDFADAARLEPEDGGLLRPRPGMAERAATSARVRQGYRELSNVDEIGELIEMMVAFRTLEASQRVIQAVDRSTERLVNER
jgi:flagellar basal-body rod protein FlgF